MIRGVFYFTVSFLIWISPSLTAPAEPPWTATESDYIGALTAGKRLTPEGAVDHPMPANFRGYSDTASAGFGTFQIGVPDTWSAWTIGAGPIAPGIISIFEANDPNRAAAIKQALLNNFQAGAHKLRGMFAVKDGKNAGLLTVSIRGRLNEASVALFRNEPETFARRLMKKDVQELARLDHPVSDVLRTTSYDPDASSQIIDYLVVETANNVLWSLTCVFHENRQAHYQALCNQIISSFAPGAFVKPPGEQ